MKSKTLYSKLISETVKRQKWVTALISLVMFVLYPIMGLMTIDRWINVQEFSSAEVAERFAQYFVGTGEYYSSNSLMILLGAVFLGVLSAINGFSYLHSRNKVDFYHSLPVKREKLFLIQGIASMLCFIIPSLISMILMMLLGGMRGLFSLEALGGAAAVFGISVLFFLLAYGTGALAMLLTGRILVGILGAGTFLVYAVIIDFLMIGFRRSYYYTLSISEQRYTLSEWLSLPGAAITIGEQMVMGDTFWVSVLLALPVIILLGLLCVWLYRKRPSEAAGRSMAFAKSANVIKILLVVPASLVVGLLFLQTINTGSDFWLVFGLIFGLLVFYGIIQMIYQMDFRSIFAQKHHIIIAAVAVGVIVSVFRFDLMGYDSYLPKQEDLQGINVYTGGIYPMQADGRFSEEVLDDYPIGMSDEIYGMSEDLVNAAANLDEKGRLDNESDYLQVYIQYNLNSGKKVRRTYSVSADDMKEDFKALLGNDKFLDMVCPIRTQDLEKIKDVNITNWIVRDGAITDGSEREEKFLKALQQDTREMDGNIISEEEPLASIYYTYENEDRPWAYGGDMMQTFIYPEFTRTLEVLKEYDIDVDGALEYADVSKVIVRTIDENRGEYKEEIEAEYTEKKDIEKILPKLVDSNMISMWTEIQDGKVVTVQTENGPNNYKILK